MLQCAYYQTTRGAPMGNVRMAGEDFLELVYGKRKGWIVLGAKVVGFWDRFQYFSGVEAGTTVQIHYYWEGEADTTISRRIDSCLRDGEDLYFSVGMFSERGRNAEDFTPTYWLWADLDEVTPAEAAKVSLAPTICWRSSD